MTTNQNAASSNEQPTIQTTSQPIARGFALYIGVDANQAAANGHRCLVLDASYR